MLTNYQFSLKFLAVPQIRKLFNLSKRKCTLLNMEMKKLKKITILILAILFIISIGTVSAAGNFTSLDDDIDDSDDSIELTQDYIFDNSTDDDYYDGVEIEKVNFALNGNGHTIDGKNQARIFDIHGHNITISNLKIINGNSDNDGGAIRSAGNITLINVTFENNKANFGGAISSDGKVDIINSTFIANSANQGGALKTATSATITGSTFKDFTNITFSIIYCDKQSNVLIENSSFMNSQAKYATAIYSAGSLVVKKSTFRNLRANQTGGAIAVKEALNLVIDSSTFDNTFSVKNAGAIFLDGQDGGTAVTTTITNNKFIGTSGDFGGAILDLGKNMLISNNSFEKCSSLYDGGAIFISQSKNTTLIGNNFTDNNMADGDGAAIYLFETKPKISQNLFINNKDSAVYIYSCGNVIVEKSTFINNTQAVYEIFSNITLENCTLVNDKLSLNNTDYTTIVAENGMPIKLINNSLDTANLPAKFDLRDWGWVTPVRNQGAMGACWTFGTMGALESALLRATGIAYDLSENNLQNNMVKFSKYGSQKIFEGGSEDEGLVYLLSWRGVIPTEYDTYDELGKISPAIATNESFHIQDARIIYASFESNNKDEIKKAILKYGAVSTSYAHDDDCLNPKTSAYYNEESITPDHQIIVVGWDDKYPASNFLETPPGNGAWIIKNSWGTDFGDNGYMYISYYDESIFLMINSVAYIIENTENYTKNYQTDLGGGFSFTVNEQTTLKYQNNYESIGNDLISGVGTYFAREDSKFTLEIYVNGQLKHQENGTKPFDGYHTIKLSKEIPISTGDNVSVVMIKNAVPIIGESMQHFTKNTSFLTNNNKTEDLALKNQTASLKMYTKDLPRYSQSKFVNITTAPAGFISGVLVKSTGGAITNATVTYKINGTQANITTDSDGRFIINVASEALVEISFAGDDYNLPANVTVSFPGTDTVRCSTALNSQDVKLYACDFSAGERGGYFTFQLVDENDDPIANRTVFVGYNGATINRTTDENGFASVQVNLIKAGQYTVTTVFLGDESYSASMAVNKIVIQKKKTTITAAAKTFKAKAKTKKYTVTIKTIKGSSANGKTYLKAGKKVTLKINGKTYTAKTNAKGKATFKLKLTKKGKFKATIKYAGDNTYAKSSKSIKIKIK